MAKVFVGTGNPQYAAEKADYASPVTAGYHVLRRPAVQDEVRRLQRKRLYNDLLPLALDLFERVLTDEGETTRNRLTAASKVADLTLKQDQQEKPLEPHEMTMDQIQSRMRELRAQQDAMALAARDVTPDDDDASSIDAGSDGPFG